MRNEFKILVLVGIGLMAYSQPAMSREFADIYTECGLGAMIAPRNEAVAAVTNVTWDSGTTAISSNITSPDTCKGGQEKVAAFINDSYKSLENDLASGQGTYLNTLATLAGKESNAPQFIAALRSDFATLVADSSYSQKSQYQKAEALYNLIYKSGITS